MAALHALSKSVNTMALFAIILVLAAFLCSLVAGFLFAFAVVVMPGIKVLPDREFIRTFQVVDGVIQNNQPLFLFIWVGSVVSLAVATIFALWQLADISSIALLVATFVYLVGVQLPTLAVNVPLNNRLQDFDVLSEDDNSLHEARRRFESRWNFWNSLRTTLASAVSVTIMVLLLCL